MTPKETLRMKGICKADLGRGASETVGSSEQSGDKGQRTGAVLGISHVRV